MNPREMEVAASKMVELSLVADPENAERQKTHEIGDEARKKLDQNSQEVVITTLHRKGGALGLVVALQFLPVLLAGAWGGVVADRFDKRRTLMITQTAMAIFAGGLAYCLH